MAWGEPTAKGRCFLFVLGRRRRLNDRLKKKRGRAKFCCYLCFGRSRTMQIKLKYTVFHCKIEMACNQSKLFIFSCFFICSLKTFLFNVLMLNMGSLSKKKKKLQPKILNSQFLTEKSRLNWTIAKQRLAHDSPVGWFCHCLMKLIDRSSHCYFLSGVDSQMLCGTKGTIWPLLNTVSVMLD